jgi:uncharacterized protein (TIGR03790 family)
MKTWACATFFALAALAAGAAERGEAVVVVYNQNFPESKKVAEHYAQRRNVPANHLLGVDVNAGSETMSRAEFRDRLEKPIFDWLVDRKFFTPNPQKPPAVPESDYRFIVDASVRYLVLCYGVPLKVTPDPESKEKGAADIPEALRSRDEAAVDAELALLPMSRHGFPLMGPLPNPFYLGTNASLLHPTNGLLMVSRLDGPSAEIAAGLVDKALQAETNGLWGRAYFDARGITSGGYKLGDDWMRLSAEMTRRLGFETVIDLKEQTFGPAFPISQIAFYAGWYDPNVSGPFIRPKVEFMPGAFAYHLHSFNAATLRLTNQGWVGPLLQKGATVSFGSVYEPVLSGTPNVPGFLERFAYLRFSFGEAAYFSQAFLSWQTTVLGDPLYRPFNQPLDALHARLERENHPLLAWSHLRVVDLNEATDLPAAENLKYLNSVPLARRSAVLMEKSGDLWRSQKRLSAAAEAYTMAARLDPSPQQKIRLLRTVGELQGVLAREKEAFDAYLQLVTETPDYPDAAVIYDELASLARKLDKKDDAEKFARQAEQLRGKK